MKAAPAAPLAPTALAEALLLAGRIEFFDLRQPDDADATFVRALQAGRLGLLPLPQAGAFHVIGRPGPRFRAGVFRAGPVHDLDDVGLPPPRLLGRLRRQARQSGLRTRMPARPPMNIKITDKAMTSDTTPHSTCPDGVGWAVTWLAGRILTRKPGHHGHGAGRDGRRRPR